MAPIFFVVFVLMAQFVLVNVVVAVLMKHLEESHKLVCPFFIIVTFIIVINAGITLIIIVFLSYHPQNSSCNSSVHVDCTSLGLH